MYVNSTSLFKISQEIFIQLKKKYWEIYRTIYVTIDTKDPAINATHDIISADSDQHSAANVGIFLLLFVTGQWRDERGVFRPAEPDVPGGESVGQTPE